jgi:starch synthase
VLFVSPEMPPWVKSGGLGDVARALPGALRNAGVDIRILIPAYPAVLAEAGRAQRIVGEYPSPGGLYPPARVLALGDLNNVPLYAVDCPPLFDRPGGAYHDAAGQDWADAHVRFGLFSRIAANIAQTGLADGFRPAIVHCNDWTTGLVPAYLRWAHGADVRTVMTLHNVAHQGIFPPGVALSLNIPPAAMHMNGVEYYGNLSFLKAGIVYADRITTVSPRYAVEMQTPEGGHGMGGLLQSRSKDIVGILNGIDTTTWDPRRDPFLTQTYDEASLDRKRVNKRALQELVGLTVTDDSPLVGVISRLAHQKGLDLLAEIAAQVVKLPAQIVILGAGDKALEATLTGLARNHPKHIAARIGFDERLAHWIEAGADMFAMPSRFEPCGLNQLYSLRYGTPPIVRATGGLADTVTDYDDAAAGPGNATGFVFEEANGPALLDAIKRAVTLWRDRNAWRALQRNGMRRDWSWEASARKYLGVYEELMRAPAERSGY